LLVGRISIKDILPSRALQQRQISGNAPVPHFDAGSQSNQIRPNQTWRKSGAPREL
jgi:hypothetical protein